MVDQLSVQVICNLPASCPPPPLTHVNDRVFVQGEAESEQLVADVCEQGGGRRRSSVQQRERFRYVQMKQRVLDGEKVKVDFTQVSKTAAKDRVLLDTVELGI